MTGVAHITSASICVSALAPPACPLTNDIACFPHSSMHTMAGSLDLCVRCSATLRTAIPLAVTNTMASTCSKYASTHALTVPFIETSGSASHFTFVIISAPEIFSSFFANFCIVAYPRTLHVISSTRRIPAGNAISVAPRYSVANAAS